MELALLKAGRGGVKPELDIGGVARGAPVDADRGIPLGNPEEGTAKEDREGLPVGDGRAAFPVDGRLPKPAWLTDRIDDEGGCCGATGGSSAEDMLPALVDLLCGADPFGGGGVARADALEPFGSFLLIHFFKSAS
jgi:hypothetical protein